MSSPAQARVARAGGGCRKVEGLWRRGTKGVRGEARPGSWRAFCEQHGLLEAARERIAARSWSARCPERPRRRVHFAGLNTAMLAEALEGRPVLVSYADIIRRPGVWRREILPRLEAGAYGPAILDSGAFTELTEARRGREFRVDVEAYGRFALEHRHLFDVVVTLDDIGGDLERTRANTEYLEGLGLDVLPVFHQGEPWELLEEYIAKYDRIGVGLDRPIRGARAFLAELFERIDGRVLVHGFGLVRYMLESLPFDTADSTTHVSELRALGRATELAEHWPALPETHGVGGALVHLAELTALERARLVLASYDTCEAYRVDDPFEADRRADSCIGQARTVLSRFTAGSLEEALEAIAPNSRAAQYAPLAYDPYALVSA